MERQRYQITQSGTPTCSFGACLSGNAQLSSFNNRHNRDDDDHNNNDNRKTIIVIITEEYA